MPSHRAQVLPRYPEGYRTLPRNTKTRPESICSVTPSVYDKAFGTLPPEDKRRSMRDDTMWQLYEWQQRQFYNKQTTLTRHGTLSSPKTMINISDQTMHLIPTSPSHGSIAGFQGYSPQRNYRSEVSSPVQRGDVTIDRRHRPHHNKVKHLSLFVVSKRTFYLGYLTGMKCDNLHWNQSFHRTKDILPLQNIYRCWPFRESQGGNSGSYVRWPLFGRTENAVFVTWLFGCYLVELKMPLMTDRTS